MSSSLNSAYKQLGISGIFGVLVMVAGIAVLTWENWRIAVGVALVLAGIGFVIRAMLLSVLSMFGMGMGGMGGME